MAGLIFLPIILPLLLNQQIICRAEFTFSAIAPLSIIPGTPYKISTTLESGDDSSLPVTFKYELTNRKNETVGSSEDIKLSKPGNQVTILKVDLPSLKQDSYNLTVTVKDAGGKVQRDRLLISKDVRNNSILIQTDKPIYKPGETVKFRVIVLNRFLQPFGESKVVHVTVKDPPGNVIKLWKSKQVPSGKGFISEEFELSKEPNLGDWQIQVDEDQVGSEHESHSFTVEEYVLPKYKVEISLMPKFITYNESKFTAEVSAMYSYGKPVAGECTLELRDPNDYNYQHYGYKPKRRWPSVGGPRTNESPPAIIKTAKLEEGKGIAKIEFDPKAELKVKRDDVQKWGKDFTVFASCKDQASGNVRNATQAMKMYEFPYKIEMAHQPNNILPGFPFNITLKVADHDDNPIKDVREDALKIEHGFKFNGEDGILWKPIPGNGLVEVSFMPATNPKVCYESLDVTYKMLKENLWLSSKEISRTGSYMQLKLLSEFLVEGHPIEVQVKTSKKYHALNLLLISRGIIIHSELIKGGGSMDQNVNFELPPKSSPKVTLFIYAVFEDKTIASDDLELRVKPQESNNLKISLSEYTMEPGHNISISFKGRPDSILGLRAVDQSVLILKQDDDLSLDKLIRVGEKFVSGGHGYWSADQVFQNFFENGLGLLTNVKGEKGASMGGGGDEDDASVMEMAMDSAGSSSRLAGGPMMMKSAMRPLGASMANRGGAQVQEVRVRSFFPETWIWEDIENREGSITIQKTVPDTITSWLISAFQINPEHGLGLTRQPPKLTVFRPFFIALNLPYSVVKGEVLFLQVLVHNYMDKDITAKVTLENQEDSFKFLESEGTFDKMDKDVEVKASQISAVIFPIVPSKFGVITLKAKAVSNEAGDAVKQTLIVRPPGIKHTQNSAVLVNLLKSDVFKKKKMSATFPEQRVPDADFLKVQVIGDVLGGTLNNLDHLIQLPTGCAEQNMLNFVPDVVILDYLNTTGQLLPEVEANAKHYLEQGYQQQLTYLRYDGSYSAFGNSDQVGSTWLTAYVTRAFIRAKRHIHIDNEVIHKSLRYLLRQQNDNGSFSEEGFVIYNSLQGGGTKGPKNLLPITAYALLTIAEAQKAKINLTALTNDYGHYGHYGKVVKPKSAKKVIASGVKFLIKQTSKKDDTFTDVYSANLIAYLLHYINHPKKDKYFEMVEGFAKNYASNGTIHWKQIQKQKPTQQMSKFPYMIWQPRISPATVEMTSYGLLTYLLRGEDKLADAVAIAKWLLRRRNSMGGFMSSQDTVMGITALAKFAEAINTKENLEADVKVGLTFGKPENIHTFHIGKDNRTVLQEYLLPGNTTSVSIKGSGKGTALAQLTWTYYVEAVDLSPAFNLKAKLVERDQGRNLDMEIKFAYNRTGKSNMAILEARTPSGYAFDQEELESLKQEQVFKRYELDDKDSKLQLYFESVGKEVQILNLKAYRIYLVAKHAQGVIKIYDYYDNTQTAQFMYDVPAISLCDICKADQSCDLKECKESKLSHSLVW